ncbi:anti-sigma factor domain-containing protein [Bacillus sp. JJ664]
MNKGIVLKINSHSVIVLTPDGEYLKCKKLLSSYTIGEEIQFPNYAVVVNNKVKKFIPKLVPVMIASALILMSFVLVDFNKKRVLAAGYVNIESKAKVSLILDKQLKVIALKAKNDQGKKIIAELKGWEKEPVKDVTEKLMVELEENEIIQHDEKVSISGSMDKKFSNEQKKLNKEINHIKQSNAHFENEQPVKEEQKNKDAKNKKDKKNGVSKQPSNKFNTIKNESKNDSKTVVKQVNQKGNKNKENNNHSNSGSGSNKNHQENKEHQENKHNHDDHKKDPSKKNKKNDNRGHQIGKGNHHSNNRKQDDYNNHQNNRYNKGHDRERNKKSI